MVALVFVIAVVNFLVGFLLALAWEQADRLRLPRLPWRGARRGGDLAAGPDAQAAAEVETRPDLVPERELVVEQIPGPWLSILEDAELHANSFVEASVQVLRLEVGTYRAQLVELEQQVRAAIAADDGMRLLDTVRSLVELNRAWTEQQATAMRELTRRRGSFGTYEVVAERLENLLLDQTPLIENHSELIGKYVGAGSTDRAKEIVTEIGGLLSLAHELRDAMHEALVTIMGNEQRLETFDRRQQLDVLTRLPNRLGVEQTCRVWWREDPDRNRRLSVGLIDVDRFLEVNRRLTTRVTDRLLGTLGRQLADLAAEERFPCRVFRFAGQQFLCLFPDSGQDLAVKTVEGFRRAIEALTFDIAGQQLHVTVSAGVSEALRDEDSRQLCERVERLTVAAKKSGRNRTCVDGDEGAEVVSGDTEPVETRVIRID